MPLSLRMIKESASYGIDWHGIHIIDLMSILYSFRIDNANKYLAHKRQEEMQKRGIAEIRPATEAEFDSL